MRDDILARFDKGIRNPGLDAVRRAFTEIYESQRMPREELDSQRLSLASRLVSFASEQVPIYRQLYGGCIQIANWDDFRALPILERAAVAESPLTNRAPTRMIGVAAPVTETSTSGTTGKKVVTSRSLKFEVWRAACRILEYDWAGIDPRGSCLIVRSDTRTLDVNVRKNSKGHWLKSWEEELLENLMPFGPGLEFQIGCREELVAASLKEHSIDYITTTPTTLETLIPYLNGYSAKKLFTIGEMLSPESREQLELAYSAKVYDAYGTRETGRVAAQCPESQNYHVHDLNVILEVVDDSGRTCLPGEIGHVLITSLHNFAMPMIRYRVGDLAVLRDSCECGRSFTCIERFEGREVNRILLPGGRKRIARTVSKFLQLTPTIGNYRIRQWGYAEFEIVIDGASTLSESDTATARALLEELTEQPVQLIVTHIPSIPPLPSGKRSHVQILFMPEE